VADDRAGLVTNISARVRRRWAVELHPGGQAELDDSAERVAPETSLPAKWSFAIDVQLSDVARATTQRQKPRQRKWIASVLKIII